MAYLDSAGVKYFWRKIRKAGLGAEIQGEHDDTKAFKVSLVGGGDPYGETDTEKQNKVLSSFTVPDATSSLNGFMSASDKSKLDGIEKGANNYTHPAGSAGSKSSGLYKIATDSTSHVSGLTAVTKSDITALGIPAADTHYTSKNVAGATSSATANAAASNGSVYLNSVENGAVTSANLIKGTGATTVTSAADGTITVNSTDTKYTLPTASASTLGGVKVGDNLSISSSGVLSAASGTDEKVKTTPTSASSKSTVYFAGSTANTETTGTLAVTPNVYAYTQCTNGVRHTRAIINGGEIEVSGDTTTGVDESAQYATLTHKSLIFNEGNAVKGSLTPTTYTGKAATAGTADNVAWSGVTDKPDWVNRDTMPTGQDIKVNPDAPDTIEDALVGINTNKAPLASPALTGIPTAPTAAAGTSSTQIATTAFVSNAIASEAVGHAKYQGGITPTTYAALKSYKQGWYWVVTTAGTIAGEACEIGDMVFCNTDSASGATAPTASHFDVVQNNITSIPTSEIDALS